MEYQYQIRLYNKTIQGVEIDTYRSKRKAVREFNQAYKNLSGNAKNKGYDLKLIAIIRAKELTLRKRSIGETKGGKK